MDLPNPDICWGFQIPAPPKEWQLSTLTFACWLHLTHRSCRKPVYILQLTSKTNIRTVVATFDQCRLNEMEGSYHVFENQSLDCDT